MRFHIGFSKSIKSKTIIKFLIALGLLFGCRVLMGYQVVFADSYTNITFSSSTFSNGKNIYLYKSDSFVEEHTETPTITYDSTSYGRKVFFGSSISSKDNKFVFAIANGLSSSSSYYNDRISEYSSLDFNNNSYCPNNTSSLKSMNIEFPFYIMAYKNDLSYFRQSYRTDTFRFYITAHSGDHLFTTACSHSGLDNGDDSSFYLVSCNNVFQGNSDYQVSSFTLTMVNLIPFNDRYASASEDKGIIYYWELGNAQYNFSHNYNINYQMRFSCSDDEPNLENAGGGDDDDFGLNDIYDVIKESYENGDYPNGISQYLHVPSSVGELVSFPLYLLQAVYNNGDNTCSNYEIDFSSLADEWLGHGYNMNSYKLKLPCMRNILSQYFGALYTLADILLACLVFYSIAKHIVVFVDLLTEGEDLYAYYFEDDDDLIGGKRPNAYVNHKTGEVSFKK